MGGALRLRKQFVQKFDGADFTNDTRNTIISGSRDIEITDVANRDQGYVLVNSQIFLLLVLQELAQHLLKLTPIIPLC